MNKVGNIAARGEIAKWGVKKVSESVFMWERGLKLEVNVFPFIGWLILLFSKFKVPGYPEWRCHRWTHSVLQAVGMYKSILIAYCQSSREGAFFMFKNPYLKLKSYVVGMQKNCLSVTILLSTHNIEFGWVMREILWEKDKFTTLI